MSFTIALGDPFTGLTLHGVFETAADASRHADERYDRAGWHVVEIYDVQTSPLPVASMNLLAQRLGEYYTKKFNGHVWADWDDERSAFSIGGDGLPPHPELRDKYPNGWSLLDYVSVEKAIYIAINGKDIFPR